MTLILCAQEVQASTGGLCSCVQMPAELGRGQGPPLGAVMAEDDGAEVPAVTLFDEILRGVGM